MFRFYSVTARSCSRPWLSARRRMFSTTTPWRIMETTGFTDNQLMVREAVSQVCAKFPNTYWQEHDQEGTDPKEFHAALAADGWLGVALPEAYGGSGLGISEATIMMQTIAESGAGMAGAQAIHANVYATQPLAKFGTKEQLEETIPKIISGEWRTCFGVTEPNAGLNPWHSRQQQTRSTTKPIRLRVRRSGSHVRK
jgi:acyl-CoA dehydrogenase